MSDISETLKELLGDNAEEKINSVLGMLGGGSSEPSPPPGGPGEPALTPELIAQLQRIMGSLSSGGGDDRSRLLLSLKPFMRETRQRSIDSAIKLISLAKLSHMFKEVL